MNAITEKMSKVASRVTLNKSQPEEETEHDYRLQYDVADSFRYAAKSAISTIVFPQNDLRQIGDAVCVAAKQVAENCGDDVTAELAESVAKEWSNMVDSVVELKKKMSIAIDNAHELVEKMNYNIAMQVLDGIDAGHFGAKLTKKPSDADVKSMCKVLGERGVMLSNRTWFAVIDSNRMNDLVKLHHGENVDDLNRLKILFRQTIGESNSL